MDKFQSLHRSEWYYLIYKKGTTEVIPLLYGIILNYQSNESKACYFLASSPLPLASLSSFAFSPTFPSNEDPDPPPDTTSVTRKFWDDRRPRVPPTVKSRDRLNQQLQNPYYLKRCSITDCNHSSASRQAKSCNLLYGTYNRSNTRLSYTCQPTP